jgi:MFS transporter, SHS family, lactate transporter
MSPSPAPSGSGPRTPTPRDRFHAVMAGYLGWTMDAFDFFVVVFLVDTLAQRFGVPKKEIVWTLTATLALRPVGAIVFGLLADRYGRRIPLMANLLFFSTVEVLCGFAPNYATFLVLRALFGIGMGGEWGVGASLAMESAPRRWRGVLSGILQSGYSMGYLLAALAARLVLPAWGWRAMFWIGGVPALLAFYVRWHVPESEAWRQKRAPSVPAIAGVVRRFAPRLAYLVALMTMMMFLSHGTQDLYPDFLKIAHGIAPHTVADVAVLYNVGAILGAVVFGQLSQRLGRRRAMAGALVLCLLVMPLWAFGGSLLVLAAGAFFMQMGVQGAWGIIPAHLNELSPDETRGLVPGLAYQLGILFASPVNTIEYALRDRIGYGWALAAFEAAVIAALLALLAGGPEQHGKAFLEEAAG